MRLHFFLRERTIGALRLPDTPADGMGEEDSEASSGNIVIEGSAGSGKSTLAMQFAMSFVHWPNSLYAIYLALEESIEDLHAKLGDLSPTWQKFLKPMVFLDRVEDESSPEAIGRQLELFLTQPDNCPTVMRGEGALAASVQHPAHKTPAEAEAQVLLPRLSPRNVVSGENAEHPLFWDRLRQLERLLMGAKWLREKRRQLPQIRLVCIDSINAFGDRRLTRDELYRLFELFRKYGMIGLCTVEASQQAEEMAASDLVDVLIRLGSEKDNGYFIRYLEILKSRYHHQVYGRHPFKLRSEREAIEERRTTRVPDAPDPLTEAGPASLYHFQAVKVVPSIHYIVGVTDPNDARGGALRVVDRRGEYFDFGIEGLRHVLSPSLMRGSVLAVVGERNTFKSPLSRHFLMHGLCRGSGMPDDTESVLLVSLQDHASFDPKKMWMLAEDLFRNGRPLVDGGRFSPIDRMCVESKKVIRRCWRYAADPEKPAEDPVLFELALKGGAILPEEFLQYIRNVMRHQPTRRPIRRVVLDDVALIGVSYPFLRHSQNAGDLFLSAFVHLMRNYGVDLLLVGTRTGLREADQMVSRACALADEILFCEYCDVFGDRYVTIRGGGLAVGQEHVQEPGSVAGGGRPKKPGRRGVERRNEMVPVAVVPVKSDRFQVDDNRLRGLVGFGTNRLHRPGLTLHTFQENSIHREYTKELLEVVGTILGVTIPREAHQHEGGPSVAHSRGDAGDSRQVEVAAFAADANQAFHDGLELMAGRPMDKTIVATVDEFFMSERNAKRRKLFVELQDNPNGSRKEGLLKNIDERMKRSAIPVRPYYANVLLVAFGKERPKGRRDWLKDGSDGGPRRVGSWESLARALGDAPAFSYDNTAKETGACLLLDAICGCQEPGWWERFCDAPEEVFGEGFREAEAIKEITSLQGLVLAADARRKREQEEEENRKDEGERKEIRKGRKGFDVYVYWYSQLRWLLGNDPIRAHDPKLEVCAVPGGGFTGDWYIGVVQGSVSVSLGHDLVDVMCQENEEYKRLDRGVGLPTRGRFYEEDSGFSIWPGSGTPLSDLRKIHDGARSRARISDYQKIKAILYGAWQELGLGMDPECLLKALPKRIRILCG